MGGRGGKSHDIIYRRWERAAEGDGGVGVGGRMAERAGLFSLFWFSFPLFDACFVCLFVLICLFFFSSLLSHLFCKKKWK